MRRPIEGQAGDPTPKERVDGGVDALKPADAGVESGRPAQGILQPNGNIAGIFRRRR